MALFAVVAGAHPSVSIVIDSGGNVYYSDLEQVWRVAPDGSKTVAVPHVHTHELFLDPQDNLYGEHLWYEGGRHEKVGSLFLAPLVRRSHRSRRCGARSFPQRG